MMHPRPSPIAASLYTLRDMNTDVIIMHGPKGCCFRTSRLLESDGVRVVTSGMSENDFILGASEKLEETIVEAYEKFNPKLMGIVGTCASMIIGEDLESAIENVDLDCRIIPVETHAGLGEGDNTEGAILVLKRAVEYGVITEQEANRQIKMLEMATQVEKTRGMAQGKYVKPNFGDNKEKIASLIVRAIKENKKVAFVLNVKKETSYLFADILNFDYRKINPNNKPLFIGNLSEDIGLARIRQHAKNVKNDLKEQSDVEFDYITGGLDEYPIAADKALEILKSANPDLVVVAGVPHALKIEEINAESIAVTDGPRLVEALREDGFRHVVAELDAHSKTLGVNTIVDADFAMMIRSTIDWENEK